MSDNVQITNSQPKTWMNIAALVSAVLGLAPAAIVFGHLGVAAARRGEADLKSLGQIGLVIGYLAFVLAILVVIVAIAIIAGSFESCTLDAATNACVDAATS